MPANWIEWGLFGYFFIGAAGRHQDHHQQEAIFAMTSIASLTQSIDTLAENSTAMFTAMLDAKDREHGEIEAEQAKANAEFEARKARNRAEKEKIGEWGRVQADDIRAILEGDQ